MNILKMHGLGNDFILTEEQVEDPSAAAKRLCARHVNIGADGLVILSGSGCADFKMRIINSDGSEAEMCGNAIRCAAKYMYETGKVVNVDMSVETLAGVMHPHVMVSGGKVEHIKVNMGKASFEPGRIPAKVDDALDFVLDAGGERYSASAALAGVPHVVLFADAWSEAEVLRIGEIVESHALFPRKINVDFAETIGENHLRVRTYERGAGRTLACGTGCCAVAAISYLKGITGSTVRIMLDAGELLIENSDGGDIFMTGPAEYVFKGETC